MVTNDSIPTLVSIYNCLLLSDITVLQVYEETLEQYKVTNISYKCLTAASSKVTAW